MHPVAADPERIELLDAEVQKHHGRQDALITILHRAQELFGFLDPTVLWHVSRALRLPPSRVFGVASFYHLFHLKLPAKHLCTICMGTACYVKGASQLLASAERECGIRSGQSTADNHVSVSVVRCTGTCGIAPLVVLDEDTIGPISAGELSTRLQEWMNESH